MTTHLKINLHGDQILGGGGDGNGSGQRRQPPNIDDIIRKAQDQN